MSARDQITKLQQRMQESIIGQSEVVERLLVVLLCNGNVLVEGLPGLAKTRAVKSLAKNLEAEFSRIQFTPDLLPSDITGSEMYLGEGGEERFAFQAGPIFANIVLADEVNRAPAKVQAALLEAMEERTISVGNKTHSLPPLFMVMATQNPIEQEGTYPLPEAQMDRFLMKVLVEYPPEADEVEIMRLVRGEEAAGGKKEAAEVIKQDAVLQAREEIRGIHVSESIENYIVALISATRDPGRYEGDLKNWIEVGASPRGTLSLDKAGRAYAWLKGRDHVLPDDIQAIAPDVLRHRLMLSFEANAEGVTAERVIEELLTQVAVG
ncbi:MAG: MoxR-like ATPase [Verrucomicrobiales bacterium]|jgi:MoxR-like ATPase